MSCISFMRLCSVAWCRHASVIMGAHERLPHCSLFLLMNKSVKCILTLGPFGRDTQKSHDAKNKNSVETMQWSLRFPARCKVIPSPLAHLERDPGPCSMATVSESGTIKLERFEEARCALTREIGGKLLTPLPYERP